MKKIRTFRTVPAAKPCLLAASCAVAFLFLLLLAGPQRADAAVTPFKINFDDSKIDVSVLKDLPLDTLASDASIEGTVDDKGVVKIPKGSFKLPELGITTPVAIKGFMGIEDDAFGKWDAKTGQLDIDAEAGLWVSINIKQALTLAGGLGVDLGGLDGILGLVGENLTCGFAPMDVHFTTEGTSLAEPGRFAKGTLGPGSLSAEWSKLGPFTGQTKVFGIDACTTIKTLLPGLLNSLAGDALGGLDLGSILGSVDLDNVDLGPSGITLIRTADESPEVVIPPKIDGNPKVKAPNLKLKVSPRARAAAPGKMIRYRATVTNTGTAGTGGVSVCVKAPQRAVKAQKACRNFGTIAARGVKYRTFRIKIKPGVSGRKLKLTFRTKTSAKTKPKRIARLRVR